MADFSAESWYQAMTLRERRALLRAYQPATTTPEEANDLLERWRHQDFFAPGDLFAKRLIQEGWTEEEFANLLAIPAERFHNGGAPPPWLAELARAFDAEDDLPLSDLKPSRGEESSPFLVVARPVLAVGYRRLQEAFARLTAAAPRPIPWREDPLGKTLFSHIAGRLSMFLRRTMVLELQIAGLEERLQGDTPEERFQDFVRRLDDQKTALEILSRYPVLARQVVQCVDQWVAFATEFLARFARDASRLPEIVGVAENDLGTLVEARPGAGDSHRDGRSVILLTFSSGHRLVYKPRSLEGEKHFNDLLRWTNSQGFEPAFRALRILNLADDPTESKGEYGWVEFVEPASLEDAAAAHRFYRRQGGNLALLYLLDANDIHFENVIAVGEHPIIVDLETLFQPSIDVLEGEIPFAPPGNAFFRSVNNVGLLPHRMWGAEGQEEGVDLSGLGAAEGQRMAQRVLNVEGAGTDHMHFARYPVEIPDMDQAPRIGETRLSAADYRDAIADGFEAVARLVLAHREEFLARHGPLATFADTEIRVIFRPTIYYNSLLGEGFHPDVLQDGLERDLLFDGLWAEVAQRPRLAALVAAEKTDLERADIPLFSSHADSRDLESDSGEPLPNYWPDSGLDRSRAKVRALDETDIARQRWLIETSLDSLSQPGQKPRRDTYPFREGETEARAEALMAAAVTAGERLEALAFRGPGDATTWSIVQPLGVVGHWAYGAAEPGLYQGLAGIAVFLAHLGARTGQKRFTDLARSAWATVRYQLQPGRMILPGVGAYTGWGGIFYSALHLASLWDEPTLLEEMQTLAGDLRSQIEADAHHDFIGGAAGCLLSLLAMDEIYPSPRLVETAVACGESLLASAQDQKVGCGWVLAPAGPTPLAGLSHGAAGIALALAKLTDRTGDERFRQVARRALDYERALFSPAEQNWVDLRQGDRPEGALEGSGHHFVVGWCHGAPGIALARLAGLPYLDDAQVRQEIEIALRTTMEQGFGSNHCLCHGDLGNLDPLLLAAQALDDDDLHRRTYRLASGVLNGIRDHGWLFGYPAKVEPLGLMVGLAGIGYQLLRLAAPERVPSILVLEAPAAPPLHR